MNNSSSLFDLIGLILEENFGDTCQFFGYRTKFKNLIEVFNMNSGNLLLNSKDFKPWYIGW